MDHLTTPIKAPKQGMALEIQLIDADCQNHGFITQRGLTSSQESDRHGIA